MLHADTEHQRAAGQDLWAVGVLPVLAVGSLAGFIGIYWDISWHIDKGRDTFFTPPHDFVYTNMAVVLAASLYGMWRDLDCRGWRGAGPRLRPSG